MNRKSFVATALAAEWRSFGLSDFRALHLRDVVVVDYSLRQEAVLNGSHLPREWVMSDVWALEDDVWRLAFRHPEPVERAREPQQ